MKYQVMEIREDGTLKPIAPVSGTIFRSAYDAEALAYELGMVCKGNFTVHQIF